MLDIFFHDIFPRLSLTMKEQENWREILHTHKIFTLKNCIGYFEGIDNGPIIKLSIIMALRGCPFLNKLYLLKDVELNCSPCKHSGIILHMSHGHITLHTQHRVSIPDLFPVQQLSALNFIIYLIRLSEIKKKKVIWSSFPTLYHAFATGGKWNEFVVLSCWRFLWTVLYA